MALQPPYFSAGTITLTNGSANFTTSGANLQTNGIQPGTTIACNGFTAVIATVTGENAGTLVTAWAPATQTAQPYVMVRPAPGVQLNESVRALLELLNSGNLAAWAGLSSAADKLGYFDGAGSAAVTDFGPAMRSMLGQTAAADRMPYFTGASTAALATLTSFARSLLDDANAAAARTTLGAFGDSDWAAGTWTPTIEGSTVAGNHTYSTQEGRYAKFKNLVFCAFHIVMTAKDNTMAGSFIRIAGFPYAAAGSSGRQAGPISDTVNWSTSFVSATLRMNGSTAFVMRRTAAGNTVAASPSDVGSTTQVGGAVVYYS